MDFRRLTPILLVIFTNISGAGVIIPILPLYAEGAFAGTVFQVTLLASAYFAAQFISAPWLGRLSDKYGRRPILLISQVGTVIAFALFILSAQLGQWIDSWQLGLPLTGGMLMLFIARTLDGFTAGNITIAQAYISDMTPEQERARGLGLLQAAFGAGFIFGPAFGGFLSGFGAVAPFWGAAIITVLTLLLTWFTLEETLTADERADSLAGNPLGRIEWRQILRTPALMLILAIGFIASMAFSSLPSTFSLYADHVLFAGYPDRARVQLLIGLMFTFNGLMQVFTQLVLIRPLVTRFGERRLLLLGQFTLAMTFFGLAAVAGPLLATALFAPLAFGYGISEPSIQALATRFGVRQNRGRLLGLYQAARSLALILGPIVAGYVYQNIAPQAVFNFAGAFMLLALSAALVLQRMKIEPIAG